MADVLLNYFQALSFSGIGIGTNGFIGLILGRFTLKGLSFIE
jgi:F420-0:gamma-glutamyl ligase-like protein